MTNEYSTLLNYIINLVPKEQANTRYSIYLNEQQWNTLETGMVETGNFHEIKMVNNKCCYIINNCEVYKDTRKS